MKKNEKVELNLKDMENVCGGGVITGFFNPYSIPGGNPKKRNPKKPSVQFRADAAHREDHISSVLIHVIQSDERVIVVKADVFKSPQAPGHGPGFHIMPVKHQGIGPGLRYLLKIY